MRIPKNIFHTYSALENLRPEFLENIRKIQLDHKDWRYHFFSDEDCRTFIEKNYGQKILSLYDRIDPDYGAARADLFRYLIVFKLGGVYLDVKAYLSENLNNIIREDDSCLLSHWGKSYVLSGWGIHKELGPYREFQNWFIISEPNHPFLAQSISGVINNINNYSKQTMGVGKKGVVRTTGPIPYSKAIYSMKDFCSHRIIESEKTGLNYSFLEKTNDRMRHVKYLGTHYSNLSKPVIKIAGNFPIFKNSNLLVTLDTKPKKLAFICSHERSGTHFLINSLAANTNYSNNPIFDLDKFCREGKLNIFYEGQLERFSKYLLNIKKEISRLYFTSLVKTHFDAEALKPLFGVENIIFFYIFRNPVKTLSSFWRFNRKWVWDRQAHKANFKEFVMMQPSGLSTATQSAPAETYYQRWEKHVNGWLNASKSFKNVNAINYDNLDRYYDKELRNLVLKLGYKSEERFVRPEHSNYWKGADDTIEPQDLSAATDFLSKQLEGDHRLMNIFEDEINIKQQKSG